MRRRPSVRRYVLCPLTRLLLSHHLRSSSHPHSLFNNNIGAKGASALAAVLKETQITNLGWAVAPVFAFV